MKDDGGWGMGTWEFDFTSDSIFWGICLVDRCLRCVCYKLQIVERSIGLSRQTRPISMT